MIARVTDLAGRGRIAEVLIREGFRPAKRVTRFTATQVNRMIRKYGIRQA